MEAPKPSQAGALDLLCCRLEPQRLMLPGTLGLQSKTKQCARVCCLSSQPIPVLQVHCCKACPLKHRS